jgi:anti-sigma factor RsiW
MTDVRDLLPLFAVGAVDDAERRAVEAAIAADPALAAELAPWLDSWEAEATVLAWVLRVAAGEDPPPGVDLGVDWLALHRRDAQVLGTRLALYGLSYRLADRLLPHPASVVRGENLTDLAVRRVLESLHAQA